MSRRTMDRVWAGLFLAVAAAQFVGMKVGQPLSRVVRRFHKTSYTASLFVGALSYWLPMHWHTGTATNTGWGDIVVIAAGLVLGHLAHRRASAPANEGDGQ
jgi:hypothetical protein